MLNDNARKWVEALRSGEYEQARGALRTSEGYCCMGVACEEYRRETGQGNWDDGRLANLRFTAGSRCAIAVLPRPVREWLGLHNEFGSFGSVDDDGNHAGSLTRANDDGKTFAQIADIIESEPEGLFDGH